MSRTRYVVPAVLAALAACNRPPAPATGAPAETVAAWRWSLDTVRTIVGAVRAGTSLKPASWPGGARVAVLLSFDVDNETIPLRFGQPTIGELSQGQYGARVGLRRVTELLARERIPATFFIPAVSLLLSPEMVETIKRSGDHEFAVHGWIHERNTVVPPGEERALVQQAIDTLTRLTGVRPVGYRAPSWNFSPATMRIVRDLGFLYESSLMADDDPYELEVDGQPTGIVELPVEWILDDAPLFSPLGDRYSPPREVLEVWKDEFDAAYREGGMFLLTMHPHVIGHRSRMVALEGLVAHIKARPGVWFGTHRAAAEHVRPGLRGAPPDSAR